MRTAGGDRDADGICELHYRAAPAPGGADFAADTELDAVGRWTARTICGYASLYHACTSLSPEEIEREVSRVIPDYDLLTLILKGEVMAALDGCRVVGLTPTQDERDRLIPWLL